MIPLDLHRQIDEALAKASTQDLAKLLDVLATSSEAHHKQLREWVTEALQRRSHT